MRIAILSSSILYRWFPCVCALKLWAGRDSVKISTVTNRCSFNLPDRWIIYDLNVAITHVSFYKVEKNASVLCITIVTKLTVLLSTFIAMLSVTEHFTVSHNIQLFLSIYLSYLHSTSPDFTSYQKRFTTMGITSKFSISCAFCQLSCII